jgi:hypothetical protein
MGLALYSNARQNVVSKIRCRLPFMDHTTDTACAPSTDPFGEEIAHAVADLLNRDGRILWGWCSHWMLRKGDRLVYEFLKDDQREIFASPIKSEFAAWLAQQSPHSLDDFVRPASHDTIELITHELLKDAVANNAGVNDPTPYGEALAGQVVDALDRGIEVANRHRDYCGMGLGRGDRGYIYGPVYDGYLSEETTFPTREALVAWLAQQSDATLSGREAQLPFEWDNQRITRARLLEAIASAAPTTLER